MIVIHGWKRNAADREERKLRWSRDQNFGPITKRSFVSILTKIFISKMAFEEESLSLARKIGWLQQAVASRTMIVTMLS